MFESRKTKRFGNIESAYSLSSHSKKNIVLFHGYGADCWDLFGLKDYLDPNSDYNWYFPNGSMAAQGLPMGRAWFPIDIQALEEAMARGGFRHMSNDRPKQVDQLLPQIYTMFQEMGLKPEDTIIGGFSQGAMLSLEVILDSDIPFAGLIQFSSTLFDKNNLPLRAMKREGFRFFQSHGKADAILPYYAAEVLHMLLNKAGWFGDLHTFSGGHEIPLKTIEAAKQFIDSVFRS